METIAVAIAAFIGAFIGGRFFSQAGDAPRDSVLERAVAPSPAFKKSKAKFKPKALDDTAAFEAEVKELASKEREMS